MSNSSTTHVAEDKGLFWGCWIALVTTSFAFISRIFTSGEWGKELNLTNTQVGEIVGAGLWPFFISIVLFSFVMDKIGYKKTMVIGFVCHVVSMILTYTANTYNALYLATFICALGNGTVEAYINPVVATIYSKEKSKWLNFLHGGWSGGFVIAGILLIIVPAVAGADWRLKLMIPIIPTIIYFLMLIGKKFPVSESAAAGVPLRESMGEVGAVAFFVMVTLMAAEVLRSLHINETNPLMWGAVIGAVSAIAVGIYTKSFIRRPMYLILFLVMIPLATAELGTDSWITAVMTPTMGENAKWLFIITAAVMTIMRFCAGAIFKVLSPLSVLALAALGAIIALVGMSSAGTATLIFACGMLYGASKAFFWPTTLGVVSEQTPRGGAMTMNGIAGAGLLGLGILGNPFLGNVVDKRIDTELMAKDPAIHAKATEERTSMVGRYSAIIPAKEATLTDAEKKVVNDVKEGSTRPALKTMAVLPGIMLITYIGLIFYFKSRGGYKPVDVNAPSAH